MLPQQYHFWNIDTPKLHNSGSFSLQMSIIRLFTKNATFVYYRITKQLINEKD